MRILPVYSIDRPNGLERSRKVIFWTGPGARLMSALDQLLGGLLKKRFTRSFQELYVNNFPKSGLSLEMEKDRN